MSGIEVASVPARELTEYDGLVSISPSALDAIPGAVSICDHEGRLVRYNSEAAALWGRSPDVGSTMERFCVAQAPFLPNGAPLPHEICAMGPMVRDANIARKAEVTVKRPDGSELLAIVNTRPLRDHRGNLQGSISCFQDISAQKMAEKEVRRTLRDLEDFFENGAVGLHIVSAEGIILRANQAELDLLGYTVEEYWGRRIAEFHADKPVIDDILQNLAKGAKLDRYPARMLAKDGSIKHVLITSNGRFENDRFVNTRCFTMDVTHLREAESARRESEDRLAATYEAASIGIAEADGTGRLIRVNDAICQILGRSRDDLLRMSFFDYTHGDDRAEDAALFARQVDGKLDKYSVRKRALKPDGAIVHLDVSASAVRNEQREFVYAVRVIKDVTEAKRMEDRIRDSEQHMRNLLEALPAAVYTTDSLGNITFFNKACVDMAGRTPRIGEKWCVSWKLYTIEGMAMPLDQCPLAVALKEDRPVRGMEAMAERPDGTFVPFMPYPTPLHDADGKLIGAINMLVDITERKQAEGAQKALIDELNHRVKNTLATVQSLAKQTVRHSDDVNDFERKFEGRLLGLARAHDLLSRRKWENAPLYVLARDVIEPFSGGSDRLSIDGPLVMLNPRAALGLTITLHELATNAAKYGALSLERGKLSLTWKVFNQVDRQWVELSWREVGGPPTEAPRQPGFGTHWIARCIERDLGGRLELVFERDGLRCGMRIPLESLS